jgi:hypothetical protein
MGRKLLFTSRKKKSCITHESEFIISIPLSSVQLHQHNFISKSASIQLPMWLNTATIPKESVEVPNHQATYCLFSSHLPPHSFAPIPKISIKINEDLSYSLQFFSKFVNNNPSWLRKSISSPSDLHLILSQLMTTPICEGNNSPQFLALLKNKQEMFNSSCTGKKIAFIDEVSTSSPTIRHVNC